MEMFYFSCGK
jgi:hypothetical protein